MFRGQRVLFGTGESIPVTGELTETHELRLKTPADEILLERIIGDPETFKSERLRRLAEDPEVQARYKPFLAKGRYLFDYPNTAYFVDGPAQRASYNALVKNSITRDLRIFIAAGLGQGRKVPGFNWRSFNRNDRPLWTTTYPKADAEWARYRRLFLDFQQLAPLWRDMGILAP
jgi:hypothetical protein